MTILGHRFIPLNSLKCHFLGRFLRSAAMVNFGIDTDQKAVLEALFGFERDGEKRDEHSIQR
jgi:hypothetical protein